MMKIPDSFIFEKKKNFIEDSWKLLDDDLSDLAI